MYVSTMRYDNIFRKTSLSSSDIFTVEAYTHILIIYKPSKYACMHVCVCVCMSVHQLLFTVSRRVNYCERWQIIITVNFML